MACESAARAPTSLPPAPAVRLGLRIVRGLGATARDRLERALAERAVHVDRRRGAARGARPARACAHLAEAGAFDALRAAGARRAAAARRAVALLDAVRGDAGPLAPRRRVRRARARRAAPRDDARRAHRGRLSHDGDLARTAIRWCTCAAARAERRRAAREDLLRARARRRARRHGGARDLPPASGHGEGIRLPLARGRDGDDQRRRDAAALRAAGAADLDGRRCCWCAACCRWSRTVVNVRAQQFRALQAAVGAEFARRHDFH